MELNYIGRACRKTLRLTMYDTKSIANALKCSSHANKLKLLSLWLCEEHSDIYLCYILFAPAAVAL